MSNVFPQFILGLLIFFIPYYASAEDKKYICLTLMVKNDAAYIEQCLESVKDIIDCVAVCDMGSTDETIEIIEKFIDYNYIPGSILKKCDNINSLSILNAQNVLNRFGFPLDKSYLLILEPHMIVQAGPTFNKNVLKEDSYLILEKLSTFSFYTYNARLLAASLEWEYIGTIHGYWTAPNVNKSVKLRTLNICEQGDDKYKTLKLNKEVEVLTKELLKDSKNERNIFYLAQAYKSLGDYDAAFKMYLERIKLPEARDEVWFSKYMIGESYEAMGLWPHALFWYLEAYQSNPAHPESLRKIARHYRLNGQNELAYIFAIYGSKIPFPNEQLLYAATPFYDYDFDEELSIVSYYTGFLEDGYAASNNLLLKKSTPWFLKNQTYQNLLFYVQNLKGATFEPIIIDCPLILKGFPDRYQAMNPSIIRSIDGYKVICRTVNYTQTGAKYFNTIDENGIFRTRNFLLDYDEDFNLKSQKEIIENLKREKVKAVSVQGLEDARLFEMDGDLYFTCTTTDTNPYNYQISLCKIFDPGFDSSVIVNKLVPLKGPDPYRCEKNWLPFVKDKEFYVVYSYAPFKLFKPDIETGDYEEVLSYETDYDFSCFRGSAGPVNFDEGYLIMVHETVHMPDYTRCYLHRFLYLDENFLIKKLSKPFTFTHHGIEFCNSMTLDHTQTKLIMGVGLEDKEAYLVTVNLDTIRSLLTPLPSIWEPIFK